MYESAWIKFYFPFVHSCIRTTDNIKYENEINLFEEINENVSESECTNNFCIAAFI